MKRAMTAGVLGVLLLSGACYHATIETGRTPSTEKVTQKWAMGFAWGLVPPPTVETATRCPNGVARVETYHSFLNSLVGILTSGIVTPITIEVTCAAPGSSDAGAEVLKLGANQTVDELMTEAVQRAHQTGEAVFVEL